MKSTVKKEANIHELLLVEISRTSHLLNQPISDIMSKFEITNSQYNILRILRGVYPEHLNAGVMKSRMINTKSDATRLTDKLVARGLVKRNIQKDNRRQINVSITNKGLKLIEKIEPELSAFLDHFKSSFTNTTKVEEFFNYLKEIEEQTAAYMSQDNA